MSAAVKGRTVDEARALIRAFKAMMSIHEASLDGADVGGQQVLGGGLEDPLPVLARLFSAHFHADLQPCRSCCLTLYMMSVILLIMTTVMYRC